MKRFSFISVLFLSVGATAVEVPMLTTEVIKSLPMQCEEFRGYGGGVEIGCNIGHYAAEEELEPITITANRTGRIDLRALIDRIPACQGKKMFFDHISVDFSDGVMAGTFFDPKNPRARTVEKNSSLWLNPAGTEEVSDKSVVRIRKFGGPITLDAIDIWIGCY